MRKPGAKPTNMHRILPSPKIRDARHFPFTKKNRIANISSHAYLVSMKRGFVLVIVLLVAASCSRGPTQTVVKPRYHHSWYRKHVHNKKYSIGRVRVRFFEKQGVKKVKMKG
jgi:hypothetical protein